MSLKDATSRAANMVELLPDLSNYTDWEDMLICYMRAKECYQAINPDDELEKEMAALRVEAADDDKAKLAKIRLNDLKANAEALTIIRQRIHVSHRAKIRSCAKAKDAWELLRPMRNALTADIHG